MKYFILFITFFLAAISVKVHAQLNPTLYHMKDLPLNSQLNPAFQPRNGSIYVGFPGLTSLAPNLMLSGGGLTLGNAYLKPNYGAIVRGAGDFSTAMVGYEHNLINVGYMFKNMYFTFDSKLKLNVEGRIPKDLERLMWYGNGDSTILGSALNLKGLGVSALGYGEISLGVSVEVAKNAFLGAKVKYLQGITYMNVGLDEGSSFKTDATTYGITVGLNPSIYLSGLPVTLPQDSVFSLDNLISPGLGSYKFNTGSRGVAFDLGGSWDLPWVKGLNVSASILDVGFISWSGHKVASTNPNSPISFDGISLSASGSDFTSGLLDSIKQKTEVTYTSGSERRWLSPTVYAGATYDVLKYLNVGALFGYRFSQYESSPLVALSANTQGLPVNLSATYSYYNRNSNLGVGLLIGRKIVQWHIIADNLLAVNYKTAQNVNFRMGVNFLFGKSRAKRSLPAGGDALSPEAGFVDTLSIVPLQQGTFAPAARDTVAGIRYGQDLAMPVQDSAIAGQDTARQRTGVAPSVKKPARQGLSKEELLRRAMEEETEDKADVKGKTQPRTKSPVARKSSKDTLLERAMREEAEDFGKAPTQAKTKAKAKKKNK